MYCKTIDYQTAKVQSTLVFNPKICIKQWKNASSLFSFRINFFCLAYSDPKKLHLKPKIDLFLTFILQLKTHIDFSLFLMLVQCLWFYLSTQCYMHMSQVDYSNTLQYIPWREDKIYNRIRRYMTVVSIFLIGLNRQHLSALEGKKLQTTELQRKAVHQWVSIRRFQNCLNFVSLKSQVADIFKANLTYFYQFGPQSLQN